MPPPTTTAFFLWVQQCKAVAQRSHHVDGVSLAQLCHCTGALAAHIKQDAQAIPFHLADGDGTAQCKARQADVYKLPCLRALCQLRTFNGKIAHTACTHMADAIDSLQIFHDLPVLFRCFFGVSPDSFHNIII